MFKKTSSIFIALLVVLSSSFSLMTNAIDNSYFSFTDSNTGFFDATLNSGADFSAIENVDFPSRYSNEDKELPVRFSSAGISNTTIKT